MEEKLLLLLPLLLLQISELYQPSPYETALSASH